MTYTDMKLPVPAQDQSLFVCATLPGETERQHRFSLNFQDQSLYRFVESVDGRSWSEDEADSWVSPKLKKIRETERRKGKHWLNPAAIACAITHRDKLLTEAELNSLILCEDDVSIRPDFIELWRRSEIREILSEFDGVVLLHYFSRNPITADPAPVVKIGCYGIHKLDQSNVLSGACYFAPTQVARNIRKIQTPIGHSADHWLEMIKEGAFSNIYAIHPSPCTIAGMASNIGYGAERKSNATWVRLARRLKRVVQRQRKQLYETLEFR